MPEQLHQDIKLFLEGKSSLTGQKLWDEWYDSAEMHSDEKCVIQSSKSKLKNEIRQIKKAKRVFYLSSFKWTAAAAVLLVVGFSAFYYLSVMTITTKQYATKLGERAKITLTDGTQVWLNAGSVLEYPEVFNGGTREVSLTGEAFFDVAKDKKHPFIIHTKQMDTKVLGTSFNVQAYPEQLHQEVSVLTGRVNVKSTITEENVFVTPGQKAVFQNKSNKLRAFKDVPVSSISLWRKSIIVFDDTPMPEVIATINRNYNVTLELKNDKLKKLQISAYFKELPPEQVVALVCKIINAEYQLKAGVYTIQ
ncbi:FecR family protein [Flavobacterium fluviatile]|uniref:FecR family protein n=1 Tax=Flavobacterium fluviatile TaxID=1862387 RepID=UPI0013CF59ED|nr:FecR domain-containing protein [Flavobacterium fluviatile]